MKPGNREADSQMAYLDPFLVDRARLSRGWSLKKLAVEADVDYRTIRDVIEDRGVLFSKAYDIAQALGRNVLVLLAPRDPRYKPPIKLAGPWSGSPEWEPTGYLDQGRAAPNGLYYIVCRMQHRHTASKAGRGKFYHLSWLPPAKREGMRHQLSRHAEVCARVGIHPQIVVNHTSTPVANDEGWWVVDDWVGESTLAQRLRDNNGPWPRETVPRLLLDMAQGLDVLHRAGIVLRELAPARVLISDKDGRAVLTDFELAKLLDGSPSVSGDWPEDPFHAPEVDGGVTTVRADLYSFALVAGAALVGPEFDPGQVVDILGAAGMPKRLQRLLVDCSEPVPDRRPPDLSALLKELTRWAEK